MAPRRASALLDATAVLDVRPDRRHLFVRAHPAFPCLERELLARLARDTNDSKDTKDTNDTTDTNDNNNTLMSY